MLMRIICGFILCCWLVVTFAALSGMYYLWWQRERVLYLGKTVQQQRVEVFRRAGFPVSLLAKVNTLERQWPPFVHYSVQGDVSTSLSYIKYLLVPRIPSGEETHVLKVHGDSWIVHGPGDQVAASYPGTTGPWNKAGPVLALCCLTGWAVLLRQIFRRNINWPESMGLSCFFFTLFCLCLRFFTHSATIPFAGGIVVGLAGWVFWWTGKKDHKPIIEESSQPSFPGCKQDSHCRKKQVFAGLMVLIIFLALFWSLIMSVIVVPDDWDAWAIWGSKAKALALGTGPLSDVTWFGHADYPLLWPMIWAFSGWISGGWEECLSRGWGTIFLLLCVWEMVNVVKERTGSLTVGLFSGALFLSMPNVPLITSWSYAEAPLWLMFTCALAFFLRWRNSGCRQELIFVALFAAAAAYTKNEGAMFAVLLGCCVLFTAQQRAKSVILYSSVFILCYGLWFYWVRVYLALGSHVTTELHMNGFVLQRVLHRLPSAIEAIGHMWGDVRQWNITGGVLCAGVVGIVFLRRKVRTPFLLLLPLGMLVIFFGIVLLHSTDIYWLVGASWNRLTIEVLPLLIILLVPPYWRLLQEKTT